VEVVTESVFVVTLRLFSLFTAVYNVF